MRRWSLWVLVLSSISCLGGPPIMVSTLAGDGKAGWADGSGGATGTAQLDGPQGVAIDAKGNTYVADTMNNRVRKIDSSGNVTTLAGNGSPFCIPSTGTDCFADGTGGSSGTAEFNGPTGVAVDAQGNVYVADQGNNRVRKIDTSGNVTTVAGNGSPQCNPKTGIGCSADGSGGATGTAELWGPKGIAIDAHGDLYVADWLGNRIRSIDLSGNVTTVAGNGTQGFADGTGGANGKAELAGPSGIAVDSKGDLYVADSINNRIRKIDTSGNVTTIAGNGSLQCNTVTGVGCYLDGPVSGSKGTAEFNFPTGVAVDSKGNVYVADQGNNVVRLIATGQVTTFAGNGTPGFADGTTSAELSGPAGLAVDVHGTLSVADTNNNRIRRVKP